MVQSLLLPFTWESVTVTSLLNRNNTLTSLHDSRIKPGPFWYPGGQWCQQTKGNQRHSFMEPEIFQESNSAIAPAFSGRKSPSLWQLSGHTNCFPTYGRPAPQPGSWCWKPTKDLGVVLFNCESASAKMRHFCGKGYSRAVWGSGQEDKPRCWSQWLEVYNEASQWWQTDRRRDFSQLDRTKAGESKASQDSCQCDPTHL